MSISKPLWPSTFVLFYLLLWVPFTFGTVRVNHPELYLSSHNFKISATPRTRNYNFRIASTVGAPDGFSKTMLVINNQFPAPLIEANEGDTLKIVVQNDLDVDVSIHWHGIWQTGTPWMDGVTGVTQCPIPAKTSFTYRFTVREQFGTFWYHAHARNLAIDGIAGPLIVHSPRDPLVRGRDYDNDIILFISDWYHNTSTVILNGTLSVGGYFGTQAAPSANSALINGVGIFNCSFATRGSNCQTPTRPLEITLPANQKTRFRLVQAGSHAMFWFSADEHLLKVIEADSTGVSGPNNLHRLQFHNGQRYSVIVDTKADKPGSSFYLRAAMDTDCWAWLAPGLPGPDATALAIVRIASQGSKATNLQAPRTQDWNDTVGGKCIDLNINVLKPLIRQDACKNVLGTLYFNTSLGTVIRQNAQDRTKVDALSRFFVNNATWTTYRYKPLLQDLARGGKGYLNATEVTSLTLDTVGCYDIVINNLDAGIDHPLHLHGVDSHLVAQGPGNVGPQTLPRALQLKNPLRRDTYVVGGGSYLIVRVEAHNPGVWILHCHIGWHLAAGFAGVVVMQPAAIAKFHIPPANRALCAGQTPSTQNITEPGRSTENL